MFINFKPEVPKLWGEPLHPGWDDAGPLMGRALFVWGTYLFWKKYGRKTKYMFLEGTLLGWNMKLVLFCNLNFTKVYSNLNKYVTH
jgi:hypothetical protein